jgi:hypothetical protein
LDIRECARGGALDFKSLSISSNGFVTLPLRIDTETCSRT